jgi:succinyl-CoA synthetase beta subunit
MVIRLTGTNEEEGVAMLKKEGIDAFKDVIEAINKVKKVSV